MEEKKQINLFGIFCLGLGGAIGSGIFVLLGYGIGYTGRSIFLVTTLGCAFMLLAYMYNVVMSSMFVFKGGDYGQKAMLFGPTLTGVAAMFTLLNSAGLAMYANGIVNYVAEIFPGILPYSKVIACLIITLFFASSIKGSKFISILENIMTIVLLLAIAVFVIFGLPQVKPGYFSNTDGGFFTGGVGGFFAAVAIMGWACQGTTMAPVAMSAATKDAKRTIPKGILLVTLSLAVVYGLMSIVAAGVLPLSQTAGANLSATAHSIFSYPIYVIFILGGAVFAIATSLLGGIAMLRYPMQQLAEDGWLPAAFRKTTKNGYPWVTQLMFFLLSITPILFNFSLDAIVSLCMIPNMLMNIYLNFSCIRLAKKYPEQWSKSIFHKMPMPVFTIMMLLGCVADVIVAYNLFVSMQVKDMLMVVICIAVCALVAVVRIKMGAVKASDLEEKKKSIVQEAINS